jgi:hypothetical protein
MKNIKWQMEDKKHFMKILSMKNHIKVSIHTSL